MDSASPAIPDDGPDMQFAAGGARVQIASTTRTMRMYAIQESEMRSLTAWNTIASVFFSAGVGLLLWSGSLFSDRRAAALAAPEQETSTAPAIAVLVVGVILIGLAIYAIKARTGLMDIIRKETGPTT